MSPFSYLAWLKLSEFKQRHQLEVRLCPVVLAKLLNHFEQKGPGEIQPKREFLLKQLIRYARKNDIPFTTPKTHPFNPLYALRLGLSTVGGDDQWKICDVLWKAGWQQRIDMADPDELERVLSEAGLNGKDLMEKTFAREAKLELKNNVKEAIEYGCFGVPCFVYNDELFWGNDSYEELSDFIQGKDQLDIELYNNLLASTPRAAEQSL